MNLLSKDLKPSNVKDIHRELREYSSKWLARAFFSESDMNEYFYVDNDLPIVNEMSDEEIIEMVLNPEQDQETDDEEEENDVTVISNERCIQLTKELIEGMEQKPFIDKSHVMAVFKTYF